MTTINSLSGLSLNAVTATGSGAVFSWGEPKTVAGMQVSVTGSPTNFNMNLEGTIDGTNFFTLVSASISSLVVWAGGGGTGGSINSMPPVTGVRANLTSISGGTSPTFTATVAVA